MKRVSILVTHLLGSGHFSRSLFLAQALSNAGMSPQLISGGMPLGHVDITGIDFIQLPPIRSDSFNFTHLLDKDGAPASPELLRERIQMLETALRAYEPDVLVTELFPFGRRVLREEFLAALVAAKSMPSRPLVFSSVRDILSPPSNERKARQTEDWLTAFYDGVLVHSDPAIVSLGASWPVSPMMEPLLHYTGFIAPPPPVLESSNIEGKDEIIVTAGGGPVGRKLFETSIDAARLGKRQWRLLVGGSDAMEICTRLNEMAKGAEVLAEPLRTDYRAMLTRCVAAVGQCGYNTAIDWLQAGVPGVFVPFAEGGEVEQTLRAASLQKRYGYGCIAEDELTPENLAAATATAVARGRFTADDLRFDGAEQTGRILLEFLGSRA